MEGVRFSIRVAGESQEVIGANQTAVALSPQDADARYNLGNTQTRGRLDELEAAIWTALKPYYAAHNLGITPQELGRLDNKPAITKRQR